MYHALILNGQRKTESLQLPLPTGRKIPGPKFSAERPQGHHSRVRTSVHEDRKGN